ncbi:MAG: hypothetical protein ABI230_13240 [Aestuariivirga sp.]
MSFFIDMTLRALAELQAMEHNPAFVKRLKAVRKALALLEANPRHPGLKTHKFSKLHGPKNAEIFEAYAENNTPGAYRIFWHYGPGKDVITIIAITPHP